MKSLAELDRDRVWAEMCQIAEHTRAEDFTPEMARRYDELEAEYDRLTAEIERSGGVRPETRILPGAAPHRADGVPVLTREQRVADHVERRPGLSLGKYVRGILTGRWDGAEEERAMAGGTGSAGGYLVPTPLAATVIDLARNKARVFQAGAVTVPMQSATLKMARVAGDPTAGWLAENGALTASDITLEQLTFTAQTLTVLVKASRQLVEDGGPGLTDVIENAIAAAMALELDRVALYGSGTAPEPRGVMNAAGLATVSMGDNGAQLTNYTPLVEAIQTVWTANHEPGAYIMAPRTAGTIAGFADTTGQPLRPPAAVEALRPLVTKQVPVDRTQGTATTASDIILGDFSQLMIGMRTELGIEVLKERFVDNLQYGFLAYLRADVQLAHAAAFAPIVGIIP